MEEQIQYLIEKDKIIDKIITLFNKTDEKNWKKVKTCFTDKVLFDMSSIDGEEPELVTSQEIVDGWEEALKKIEKLHHQAGNFQVDVKKNEADVYCYAIATHYKKISINNNSRTFVGSYNFHLVKKEGNWLLDKFKFNLKYIDGNLDLK
jgi:hypothetical protein